ncbi:MAG TPA: FAD-dependent oxidoreductase, partial [Planctomycetes bacterium]|nr:FAD-dependent oxidoreductase [Planctomycetota bacterium]
MRAIETAHPGWIEGGVFSHSSIFPAYVYDGAGEPRRYGNIVSASPSFSCSRVATLADRYALGIAAARELGEAPRGDFTPGACEEPIRPPSTAAIIESEVVVAGAGTAGPLAAIAASRQGADVVCFDPQPSPGGIGTGGGIHIYYYGVSGGLQDEVDRRVEEVTPLFGGSQRVKGFHPSAKSAVLHDMMCESGVRFITGAVLADVEVGGGFVLSAGLAGEDGPSRLRAKVWVDCTGDGDLCAFAGAPFDVGRPGDGRLHAYSQPSGTLSPCKNGGWVIGGANFDAGWVVPWDSEDLTRARISGILQYPRAGSKGRPATYIAPALGLRQARQVRAELLITLDDQIRRRRFEDVVGFQACHHDNHSIDYQFESDEVLFWIWVCKMWRWDIGCDIPYRAMLPRMLANVLVACRALGVTTDAHHSLRMQRDIQRLGEAAGYAAAIAARSDEAAGEFRRVPYDELRALLEVSGALDRSKLAPTPEPGERLAEGLKAIKDGRASGDIWFVYSQKGAARAEVERLFDSGVGATKWFAAASPHIAMMTAAEARLMEAVEQREYGFDEEPETLPTGMPNSPDKNNRLVERWVQALALLRLCGTSRCVGALRAAAADRSLPFVARSTLALTIERLVERGALEAAHAAAMLADILEGEAIGAYASPKQGPAGQLKAYRQHIAGEAVAAELGLPPDDRVHERNNAVESQMWQLHLVVARTRKKLGMSVHAGAAALLKDKRAFVRMRFEELCAPAISECTTGG